MIRTQSIEDIHSVLKHPDMWPLIADDEDIETFEVPIHKDIHYLFEEGVIFILHPSEGDLEIHANILNDHRDKAPALAYEALIEETVPESRFDMVMPGMGDDGHTASLFPKTHGLHVNERLVIANYIPDKETWRRKSCAVQR